MHWVSAWIQLPYSPKSKRKSSKFASKKERSLFLKFEHSFFHRLFLLIYYCCGFQLSYRDTDKEAALTCELLKYLGVLSAIAAVAKWNALRLPRLSSACRPFSESERYLCGEVRTSRHDEKWWGREVDTCEGYEGDQAGEEEGGEGSPTEDKLSSVNINTKGNSLWFQCLASN